MKNAEWQLADSYPISWNNPRFDTPFERRRLRILNSLFFAVAKMKGKPSVSGREELEIPIYFFQQQFHFTLDQPKQLPRCGLLSELEAEERKRKLDAERAEKERQKRIEQGRINRLLRDAAAFQQAGEIRKYVEAIRQARALDGSSIEEVEQWSQWALAQADRIDPALSQRFLRAMQDEEVS